MGVRCDRWSAPGVREKLKLELRQVPQSTQKSVKNEKKARKCHLEKEILRTQQRTGSAAVYRNVLYRDKPKVDTLVKEYSI